MNNEKEILLSERLKKMAEVDIRTVDPAELADIETVKIKTELPVEERIRDYITQIKNPYCYLSHGIVVKVGFAGTKKLEECLETCIAMEG